MILSKLPPILSLISLHDIAGTEGRIRMTRAERGASPDCGVRGIFPLLEKHLRATQSFSTAKMHTQDDR